jgi:glycerophosphoryl diester phosphodiesterase
MAGFKKIAHRGASGHYPENTRLAFTKAIEAGADMIELDCQLSLDGHVVVFHDEQLRRTAGARGPLRGRTLAQLKSLDIGRWRGPACKGERILTLEEALEVFAGKADLCLEIKNYPQSLAGIELKVLFILSHYDYLERTIVTSFDYRSLARIRELAPDIAIGLNCGSAACQDPLDAARQLAATSLHVRKNFATRALLAAAWEEGLDVHVWTVNELRDIEAFVAMGVQGVISDFPERLSRLRLR